MESIATVAVIPTMTRTAVLNRDTNETKVQVIHTISLIPHTIRSLSV